jgi:H+/gluconate symporter-like permease
VCLIHDDYRVKWNKEWLMSVVMSDHLTTLTTDSGVEMVYEMVRLRNNQEMTVWKLLNLIIVVMCFDMLQQHGYLCHNYS